MSSFAMEMSDFSWQHRKDARPEIYVVSYVLPYSNFLFFVLIFFARFINFLRFFKLVEQIPKFTYESCIFLQDFDLHEELSNVHAV